MLKSIALFFEDLHLCTSLKSLIDPIRAEHLKRLRQLTRGLLEQIREIHQFFFVQSGRLIKQNRYTEAPSA